MSFNTCICFGVAGNFAGHLEQAGEASDFVNVKVAQAQQPKALFPFYVPNYQGHFLSVYPISEDTIKMPHANESHLQIEPEVALLCQVEYDNNQVVSLRPVAFTAYNDCSIRRPADKISEKKNWGEQSKGLAQKWVDIDHFLAGGILDRYRIASFHQRDGQLVKYGEDSAVLDYSYFHQNLLDWMVQQMNFQQDAGPAEDISQLLKQAGYPTQAIFGIGATRYTEYGETTFLQAGDSSIVVLYDGQRFNYADIEQKVTQQETSSEGVIILRQQVIA